MRVFSVKALWAEKIHDAACFCRKMNVIPARKFLKKYYGQ